MFENLNSFGETSTSGWLATYEAHESEYYYQEGDIETMIWFNEDGSVESETFVYGKDGEII